MQRLTEFTPSAPHAPNGECDPTANDATLESPSLFHASANGNAPTAYEVKFLLTEEQAQEVAKRASRYLKLDPFADPKHGHAYPTTSLCTDTTGFDVFHRTAGYNRDKYRVRQYGSTGPVFVERKSKNGDKVRKVRSRVAATEIPGLNAASTSTEWPGGWFHGELIERKLHPVCRIAYDRVAYMGASDTGAVRLTFDRNVRGILANEWKLEVIGAAPVLVAGSVICEFKFRVAMPALFKGIVADLGLQPTPFSKYRLFAQTAGLAQPRGPVDG
jgi:VTC domain